MAVDKLRRGLARKRTVEGVGDDVEQLLRLGLELEAVRLAGDGLGGHGRLRLDRWLFSTLGCEGAGGALPHGQRWSAPALAAQRREALLLGEARGDAHPQRCEAP